VVAEEAALFGWGVGVNDTTGLKNLELEPGLLASERVVIPPVGFGVNRRVAGNVTSGPQVLDVPCTLGMQNRKGWIAGGVGGFAAASASEMVKRSGIEESPCEVRLSWIVKCPVAPDGAGVVPPACIGA
jgi:hypothetical protein